MRSFMVSHLKHESLPFICETSMDILAKALYVDVIVQLMLSPSFLTLGDTKGKKLLTTATAIMFKQAMPRTFSAE
jgi:hypothetical protein